MVRNPVCEKIPNLTKMPKEQFSLMEQEVLEMLEKGAIQKVVPTQGQFLIKLILVEKKNGGNRPIINLKNHNKFIIYEHFKVEFLHCLNEIPTRTGRFAKQDRSQGGKFFSSLQQNLAKVYQVSMFRQPIQISLRMFCARSRSNNF